MQDILCNADNSLFQITLLCSQDASENFRLSLNWSHKPYNFICQNFPTRNQFFFLQSDINNLTSNPM
jgi:hypothetical protein